MIDPTPTAGSEHRRVWRLPAVRALAIQLMCGLATLLVASAVFQLFQTQISIGAAVLLQGLLAAVVTAAVRLARWWVAIQLLFPIALLSTFALHFPPLLFLLVFVFLLALYWSTFRTQVPFYPSGPTTWRAVLALLPPERPVRMIDIGSGLGGLVLALAAQRPDSRFTGIELAPLPWLLSRLRATCTRSSARFMLGNYERLDFGDYDLIFAYLSPAAMPALWQKTQREMRPGTLLLSYEFPIPGQAPDLTVLPHPQGPVLYGWRR